MVKTDTFSVETTDKIQVVNITPQVEGIISRSGIRQGIVTIMARHTTAGICVNENEPQLLKDMTAYLADMAKENPDKPYLHDCMWLRPNCGATEPHNAPAHIKQLFIGNSQTIPVKDGHLDFGQWQQVLLIEQDGPRIREVTVTTTGETVKDGLAKYWGEKAELVNQAIEPFLDKTWEGEMLGMGRYMTKGGKRIRGVLALLMCQCLGGDMDRAMDAAVAMEIIHSATLAKDDAQDGDKTRRKGVAAWVAYGFRKVTGMVDVMIPHALSIVKKYGREAVYVTIDAWKEIGTGQVKDLFLSSFRDGKVYEEIVAGKTAALFGLSATLGAIASGADKDTKKIATEYGRRLGTLFQVADDLADAEEGRSVPICFEEWIKGNGINATVGGLISKVKDKVQMLPDNEYRKYLEELPQAALERMLEEAKSAKQ